MKDTIKCCIISMGLGFVVGAVLTASNKKFQSNVKQAKTMAMEKLEEAKEEITKITEKMNESDKGENVDATQEETNSQTKQSKSKSKSSK